MLNWRAMRASGISVVTSGRPPLAHRATVARFRRAPIDAALTKFASDLSPASGQQFFDRLVAFVAECLGFEVVVVGELTPERRTQLKSMLAAPLR